MSPGNSKDKLGVSNEPVANGAVIKDNAEHAATKNSNTANGTLSKSIEANGTVTKSTIVNGTVMNSLVPSGTVTNGTVTKGFAPLGEYLPYTWNVITPIMAANAAKYINETEEMKAKGLKEMREILYSDPDLEFTDEDDILLVFLRVRKFDGKRAAEFFRLGLQYVDHYRYLLERRDSSVLPRVMRANMIGFLPYRDIKGRAIIYARATHWDPSEISAWDAIFGSLMAIRSAGDNPVNQIHGYMVLLNLKGMNIQQVIAMTRWMIFGTLTLQKVLPCFLKAFHVVNIPPMYKIGWKIIKPVLSEKVRSRFIFHKTSDLSSLYQYIPPDILPPELGGKLDEFTNEHWASESAMKEMERKYYEQLSTNGYKSKRKKRAATKAR